MPKYKYKAITPDGRIVEGEGEFPSLMSLVDYLNKENLTLITADREIIKYPIYTALYEKTEKILDHD